MGETFVSVERRPDDVALIQLNRPKANALSAAVLAQLHAAATTLHDDPPGAVVLWGGRRIFAAGADIVELGDTGAGAVGASFDAALGALASVPRATIAAVNGYALGGGLELALACDFRLCAEDSRLGLPEALLGVLPGGGGTQRLPRLIGPAKAKDLVFSGRFVGAAEALAIGLADRVVPDADVYAAACDLAAAYATGPAIALAAAKQAIDLGLETDLATGLELERISFAGLFATEDAGAGMRSFLENGPGKASFSGR